MKAGLGRPQRPATPLGRRWCLHSLPCTSLQGTCFPGRAGRAGPGPPSSAGSDFLTFWFSHLPCPRRHCLLFLAQPPPPELEPVRGRIGKGPEKGSGAAVGQHQEGEAVRSHPWPRARMRFGSTSCPVCPRGWLGADQKLE